MSETTPRPDALRQLLDSAVSPATSAELGETEAAVAAFRAGLASPASGTVQGSLTVLARRMPRRVAGVVVGTLLLAGTAAAAATDTLPSWLPGVGGDESAVTSESSVEESESSLDETVVTDESVEDDAADAEDGADDPDTSSAPAEPEQSSRDWGLCQAFTKGGEKDLTVAPFSRLAAEAEAAGQTVEEFCATVLVTPPNEKDPGRGNAPDDTVPADTVDTVDPTETTGPAEPTDVTEPKGQGSGQGKGGAGGQGKGDASTPADTSPAP